MSEEGRDIQESPLYLVEDRLKTFDGSRWPFESGTCTPVKVLSFGCYGCKVATMLQMSEAGFYYCGSVSSPDWVRCVVCHQDMDGWEEQDKPR